MENEKTINDARFDRMEHHLKLIKEDSMTLSSDLGDAKSLGLLSLPKFVSDIIAIAIASPK